MLTFLWVACGFEKYMLYPVMTLLQLLLKSSNQSILAENITLYIVQLYQEVESDRTQQAVNVYDVLAFL